MYPMRPRRVVEVSLVRPPLHVIELYGRSTNTAKRRRGMVFGENERSGWRTAGGVVSMGIFLNRKQE